MSYVKRFRKWYSFPLYNPKLTPSIFWSLFYVITMPILLIIVLYDVFKFYWTDRKLKRIEFKKKYHEERGR